MNKIYICTMLLGASLVSGCRGSGVKDKHTDTFTTGVVRVAVDQSLAPVVQQQADVFEGIYTASGIVPVPSGEVEAVQALLDDSVRLAVVARTLSQKEKDYLENRSFFPKEIKIATDGIALIVNRENPDTLLSVADLNKILTGKVSRWSELHPGSPADSLRVVFDNPNSSTVRFAIDSLCRGETLSAGLHAQADNASVIDYVAHTKGALGVIGVSWIGQDGDTSRLAFNEAVRVVSVSREAVATPYNSYKPYQAYIALGQYPLTRDIYAILTDPRSGLSSGFASFLASDRGQRIILKSGMVPSTQSLRIVNVRDTW